MNAKIDWKGTDIAFAKALREYQTITSKTVVETLNSKSKDICLKAIQYTPKADKTKVRSYWQTYGYQILNKKGLKKAELQKLVAKAVAKHGQSVSYIAAGWINAAKAFGGAIKGTRGVKLLTDGYAAKSFGTKATKDKTKTTFTNMAKGAPEVAQDALYRSMQTVLADMVQHTKEELEKRWGKG
jgi:hypothetical protein